MKKLTLSVDDAVYHAARVEAAKRGTSVSAVVRDYLRALARGENSAESPSARNRKERAELVRLFQQTNLVLGYRPTRQKTYER